MILSDRNRKMLVLLLSESDKSRIPVRAYVRHIMTVNNKL